MPQIVKAEPQDVALPGDLAAALASDTEAQAKFEAMASTHPCQRFAYALTDVDASLEAIMDRYSFDVELRRPRHVIARSDHDRYSA
jgi:hypothetical protein